MNDHQTEIVSTRLGHHWECSCGQEGRTNWEDRSVAEYQAIEHERYMANVARLTAPEEGV